MESEAMRAEFEKHFGRWSDCSGETFLREGGDGRYIDPKTDARWTGFQAARILAAQHAEPTLDMDEEGLPPTEMSYDAARSNLIGLINGDIEYGVTIPEDAAIEAIRVVMGRAAQPQAEAVGRVVECHRDEVRLRELAESGDEQAARDLVNARIRTDWATAALSNLTPDAEGGRE